MCPEWHVLEDRCLVSLDAVARLPVENCEKEKKTDVERIKRIGSAHHHRFVIDEKREIERQKIKSKIKQTLRCAK